MRYAIYSSEEDAYLDRINFGAPVWSDSLEHSATALYTSIDRALSKIQSIQECSSGPFDLEIQKIHLEAGHPPSRSETLELMGAENLPVKRSKKDFPTILEGDQTSIGEDDLRSEYPDLWESIRTERSDLHVRHCLGVDEDDGRTIKGYSFVEKTESQRRNESTWKSSVASDRSALPIAICRKWKGDWELRMGLIFRFFAEDLYEEWKREGFERSEFDRLKDARKAVSSFFGPIDRRAEMSETKRAVVQDFERTFDLLEKEIVLPDASRIEPFVDDRVTFLEDIQDE